MASPTLEKDAILAEMASHPAVAALLAHGPEFLRDARFDRKELSLTVAPANIRAAAAALQAAGYNFLEDVTAVDWLPAEPRFQISYHILSHRLKERIRLRAFVGSIDPTID